MFYIITCYRNNFYNYHEIKVLEDQKVNFEVLYMVYYSNHDTTSTFLRSYV